MQLVLRVHRVREVEEGRGRIVKVTAGDGGKRLSSSIQYMREGLTCRRWGKKTKSKTQPLQVYIVRRAWEKSHDESHDLRSHDELKIDDDNQSE